MSDLFKISLIPKISNKLQITLISQVLHFAQIEYITDFHLRISCLILRLVIHTPITTCIYKYIYIFFLILLVIVVLQQTKVKVLSPKGHPTKLCTATLQSLVVLSPKGHPTNLCSATLQSVVVLSPKGHPTKWCTASLQSLVVSKYLGFNLVREITFSKARLCALIHILEKKICQFLVVTYHSSNSVSDGGTLLQQLES